MLHKRAILLIFLLFIFNFNIVYAAENEIIKIEIKELLMYSKEPIQLNLLGYTSSGESKNIKDATWGSNNNEVARIEPNGKVYFTGKTGKVIITAYYNGLNYFTGTIVTEENLINVDKIARREVISKNSVEEKRLNKDKKVTNKNTSIANKKQNPKKNTELSNMAIYSPEVEDIELSGDLKYSKEPIQLYLLSVSDSKYPEMLLMGINWESSNSKIATVNDVGTVHFTGEEGEVTISAKYKDKVTSKTTNVSFTKIEEKKEDYIVLSDRNMTEQIKIDFVEQQKKSILKGFIDWIISLFI